MARKLDDLKAKKAELDRLFREAQKAAGGSYEQHKADVGKRKAWKSQQGRTIPAPSPIKDPARRAAAEVSFKAFCQSYFPDTFFRPFSPDLDKSAAKIESVVKSGGKFAWAMPRGKGKTTLCERAILWAVLNGYRKFPFLIGATRDDGLDRLETIKTELETNELLAEDYDEVCGPIRYMGGVANRCKGQLCVNPATGNAEPTRMEWRQGKLVLPTIHGYGSKASGAIIAVAGLTGHIRGKKFKQAGGLDVRPDLVLLDDPQTRESAKSRGPGSQTEKRTQIIRGDVLGLAGHGTPIAALMPCTVIEEEDLADTFLDLAKHPEWQGERQRLLYGWPTADGLWSEYALILAEGQRTGRGMDEATEFYRANQPAMDAGAVVDDLHLFDEGEISAVQHAVNLKLTIGEAAYAAEYDNRPLPSSDAAEEITLEVILSKLNRVPRGVVPLRASRLVAAVDVQRNMLFWLVLAVQEDFTGYVVDYGTWPDQRRVIFTKRDARFTIGGETGITNLEGQIYAALDALTKILLGREWPREDRAGMRVERCLVDANWKSDVIKQFCKQSAFAGILTPLHGKYVGAKNEPLTARKPKEGERHGLNWTMPALQVRGKVRHVVVDTNFWKSFVYARLATSMGSPGCLSLFGDKEAAHHLLAQHCLAEKRVAVKAAGGRELDEWTVKGGAPDNDLFDCLEYAHVAASFQRVELRELPVQAPKTKVISYRKLYEDAQRRRVY